MRRDGEELTGGKKAGMEGAITAARTGVCFGAGVKTTRD